MEYFAGYGFNKSHSTAYAFLAYQTAYLKANYPWHFAAALLHDRSAEHRQARDVPRRERASAASRCCRPTSTRASCTSRSSTGKGVRFGLTAIKGLGEGAINAILEARTELGGRIPSLHALCEDARSAPREQARVRGAGEVGRLRFAGRQREARTCSAAPLRRSPGAAVRVDRRRVRARQPRTQRNKELGQIDLFGGGDDENAAPGDVPLPDVPPWTEIEQLNYEKETLGLYWTRPSDRSLRRRPARVRREDDGRSRSQDARRAEIVAGRRG